MPYIASATPQKDYTGKGVIDVYHSENVYANFVPIALWQDPEGPEAAVLKAINAPTYRVDTSVNQELDGDTNETNVTLNQQKLIAAGEISAADITAGANAITTATNLDPTAGTVVPGDTTGTVTLAASVDDTILYVSAVTGITYYVKTVTKVPGVVFPHDVATVAPENGTTVQAVCDNLRLLVINCFDPIKAQYPDAFMTCSFRKKGVGSSTSQHPLGMACDIQYSKASKADYFTRAQWIRDNISYDQFILEYKTTGSKLPWHHISFNKAGNRTQVFTFMNDKNCKGPGVIGLYDLSNV
jgi:hypothetical protein